jgi:prepilin-type N-terminal cleavage/methylation domain-containing protein
MKPFRVNKPLFPILKSSLSVSSKGFTLVEMAIVLVIVGIVMALGLPLLGQLSKNIKYSDSRDIVKGTIDSIESWTAGKSHIPDLSGTGNTTDFRNIVKSSSDAFGQPLIYVYDYNSTNLSSYNICGISMTSITLNYKSSPNSTNNSVVSNVAFVVISPGGNVVNSTIVTSSTITASNFIGANNAAPVTLTNQPIPRPGGTANNATITINADTSNDIVQWVTIDELRSKINCQGAELTIVNNELPYGYNNTGYSATISATGGVPYTSNPGGAGQFKWCVQPANVQNYTTQTPYNMSFKDHTGGNNIYFNSNCQGSIASWTQSDYIAISGQPIIIVTGTDANLYICILSHVAGTSAPYNDQPITGANYATYWQQVSGGTGSTWTSGFYYPSGSNTLTIFVMDNGNNSAQKTFTFTVNPS